MESSKLANSAVEWNNIIGEWGEKSWLQKLADDIKACLNYYLSGELENECDGLGYWEAIEIINRYQKKIEKLLVAFYQSEEVNMETKLEIQRTFVDELSRYSSEVHTSIGF